MISSFFVSPLSKRVKRLLADKSLEVSLSAWIQYQLNDSLTFSHMQRKIYDKDRDVEVINGALNGNGVGTGPLIFHNRAVEFS